MFAHCLNVETDDEYYLLWANWAYKKKRTQEAQWGNHAVMTSVKALGAPFFVSFSICKMRITTLSSDARLHEGTGLKDEKHSSADFVNKFDDLLDLGPPSAHTIPAWMVARVR